MSVFHLILYYNVPIINHEVIEIPTNSVILFINEDIKLKMRFVAKHFFCQNRDQFPNVRGPYQRSVGKQMVVTI